MVNWEWVEQDDRKPTPENSISSGVNQDLLGAIHKPFQVLPGALKAAAPQLFSRLWLSPATPWAAPAVTGLHLRPTGA